MLTEIFKNEIEFSESNKSPNLVEIRADLLISANKIYDVSNSPISDEARENTHNLLKDELWETVYGELRVKFYQAQSLATRSIQTPASKHELEDVFNEIRRLLEVPC